MTENFPQSVDEQSKLGAFYLERNDTKNALEHLWLAAAMQPEDEIPRQISVRFTSKWATEKKRPGFGTNFSKRKI